jgi:hypothetical protein
MKVKTMPNGSVSFARVLLFCGIMLGLMVVLPAVAQEDCTGAEMKGYANLVFCLPPEVVIEPEAIAEANYTGGREVAASMLLDGARVGLHLLYPCQAPQKELLPAELKPFLEAYNPVLAQANYNESIPGPALWGQIGNQIFIAYQPSNQTVALVLMDINMSENMMTDFLGNLSINLIEGATPLTPGYCSDTTVATTVAPVETAAQNDTAATLTAETTAPAEPKEETLLTGREKMVADMQAAREKLAAAREKMKG